MKIILCCLFFSISFSIQANDTLTCTPIMSLQTYHNTSRINLPSGTLVILEITEQLSSEQATIGQIVKFVVKANVTAAGKVVISTGAFAIGRVKNITPFSYNNPETITIEVTSTQAVDGQQVALNGNELAIKGKFPNQATKVQSGQTIIANVMNDIEIKIP